MKNKKVLIISVNECSKPPHYPIYPIGEFYVAKNLESKCQVRVMNLEFYNIKKYQKELDRFKPNMVLVSIRNRENFTPKLKSVIAHIKKQKIPFFVGGSAVTLFGKFAEDYLKISPQHIISGEFNSVIQKFFPEFSKMKDIEKIPMPDGSFIEYTEKELMDPKREFGIECKKGCPFDCVYCINHLLDGKKIRKRKISTVVKNICDLYSHGIKNFFFVDPIFNYPKDYSYKLCVAISKKNIPGARFNAFVYPPNIGDKECRIWKKINLHLTLGADGLTEKTIKSWKKPFTVKDLMSAVKMMQKHRMKYVISLMLGGPGQTISDVKKDLSILEKINPPEASVVVGAFLSPQLKLIAAGKNNKNLPENLFISPLINIKELNKYIDSKRKIYQKKGWQIINLIEVRRNPDL